MRISEKNVAFALETVSVIKDKYIYWLITTIFVNHSYNKTKNILYFIFHKCIICVTEFNRLSSFWALVSIVSNHRFYHKILNKAAPKVF